MHSDDGAALACGDDDGALHLVATDALLAQRADGGERGAAGGPPPAQAQARAVRAHAARVVACEAWRGDRTRVLTAGGDAGERALRRWAAPFGEAPERALPAAHAAPIAAAVCGGGAGGHASYSAALDGALARWDWRAADACAAAVALRGAGVPSALAVGSGGGDAPTLLLGSRAGALLGVDLRRARQPLFAAQLAHGVSALAALANGDALVGDCAGVVHWRAHADGALTVLHRAAAPIGALAVLDADGAQPATAYAASWDGRVVAIPLNF